MLSNFFCKKKTEQLLLNYLFNLNLLFVLKKSFIYKKSKMTKFNFDYSDKFCRGFDSHRHPK